MASDEDENTVYCICRQPYNENEFMIECDVCKDWFHGSCVGVLEHQAPDIEIYHCPNCQTKYGPLVLKQRRNWHRHDYSDGGATKAVQTGTVMFIKELKSRSFPLADEIPIKRLPGHILNKQYFDAYGFDIPILVDRKDGLGMTVPHPNFTIQDVEDHIGSMREIDVIDVARQEDYKMLMREWTEYYNSTNRDKIFNVISLEFSNTRYLALGSMREIDVIDVARQEDYKMLMREWTEYYNSTNKDKIFNVISLEFSNTRLSDLVVVPSCVREMSWVVNGVWPDQLPDDCTYTRPEVQKYCLMGVRDSFTDFHIDFGGTSVWYHVLRGEKIFYLIRPTNANLNLYETWLNASNQSELFFGDQVDKCYKCVVKQGQTVFIPTGWIHAVFTPIDSLVFGGNFLHSYNVPLQLEVYAIEKRVKTPEKYLFPAYETTNWYAAKHLLDIMKEFMEENKKPPQFVFDGVKALVFHLRSWTQRKDFAKSAKHDVPEHIQYGQLLKELTKVAKACEDLMKPSQSKGKRDKKRKKKKKIPDKQMGDIDILHKHTQDKLLEMEMASRKNIYNFEDNEDDTPTPTKTRFPKVGVVHDSSDTTDVDSPEKMTAMFKFKDAAYDDINSPEHKVLEDNEDDAPTPTKTRFPKAGVVHDSSDTTDVDSPEKMTATKRSLTLKVSNGKIVSDGKRVKKGEFQPFVAEDGEDSNDESLVVDENPSRSKRLKTEQSNQPKLKLKLSINTPTTESLTVKTPKPETPMSKSPTSAQFGRLDPYTHKPQLSSSVASGSPLLPSVSSLKKVTPVPPISTLLSPLSHKLSQNKDLMQSANDRKVKTEIKSELTLSDIINQSALSTTPSALGKAEPGADDDDGPESRRNIPTIRGGLNGSIADILEASGYGTETAFSVDDDINRAPSPSMREAIQGMLSMSRGGLSSMQLFSKAGKHALKKSSLAIEDEEEQLSKCYQDDEYVYPTLEMDEEEQEQMLKGRSKPGKDETWNPKARVNINVPLGERAHRDGARKEGLKNSLEASAAKIASSPKVKRPYKKKPKLEIEPSPGPSSSCLSPTHSGSAFRPGIKAGSSAFDAASKAKKPKKGQATAKQRLGKILKIHKMGMF